MEKVYQVWGGSRTYVYETAISAIEKWAGTLVRAPSLSNLDALVSQNET